MNASSSPNNRTLSDLALRLDAKLVGDGAYIIQTIDHPASASKKNGLALAMTSETFSSLETTNALAAVVAEGDEIDLTRFVGGLIVKRHRYALALLQSLFNKPPHSVNGVHPSAVIDVSAELAGNVSIGPFVYVGPGSRIGEGCIIMPHTTISAGAIIGENCLIHSGVRIGDNVVLGNNVIIQPNATLGADGFSYATPAAGNVESAKSTGRVKKISQAVLRINSHGIVAIGDDVEIGAGSHIDRATLGATTIGRGTKIDNLVQVGHNCTIGEDCLIAGQTGISGSVKIGDRVVLAGQVGIADHVSISDDVVVGAGSGVGKNLLERGYYVGYPARPKDRIWEDMKNTYRLGKLIPDFIKLKSRVKKLEDRIDHS